MATDIRTIGRKTWAYESLTFDQFCHISERVPTDYACGDSSEDEGRSDSWDLGAGWDGACQLAREGWREGVERMVEQDTAGLLHASYDSQDVFTYSEQGLRPDVGLYCAGEPACMLLPAEQPYLPVIHLMMMGSYNCNIGAKEASNWGLGILSLVDQYESQGIRVGLSLGYFVDTHGEEAGAVCIQEIKAPSEPLDLNRLAFGIGHPASFRRLGFRWLEQIPNRTIASELGSGYGYSNYDVNDFPKELVGDAFDLFIPGVGQNETHAQTADKATKRVRALVEQAAQAEGLELPAVRQG